MTDISITGNISATTVAASLASSTGLPLTTGVSGTLGLGDGGTNAITAIEACRSLRTAYRLAISGAAVSSTNTTSEETLATIQIPANALGANGHIEVFANFTATNNANAKTVRCRLNGIGGTSYSDLSLASTVQNNLRVRITNRNATNSQVGITSATRPEKYGTASTSSIITSSVDTTANVDLVITSQKATGTDTLTLESYHVIIWPT